MLGFPNVGHLMMRKRFEDGIPQVLPVVAPDVECLPEHGRLVLADGMLRVEHVVCELVRLDLGVASVRQRLPNARLLWIEVIVARRSHSSKHRNAGGLHPVETPHLAADVLQPQTEDAGAVLLDRVEQRHDLLEDGRQTVALPVPVVGPPLPTPLTVGEEATTFLDEQKIADAARRQGSRIVTVRVHDGAGGERERRGRALMGRLDLMAGRNGLGRSSHRSPRASLGMVRRVAGRAGCAIACTRGYAGRMGLLIHGRAERSQQ